jgi:Mg-chelatase subunit ChlD
VGELDETAVEEGIVTEPDETLGMLADLTSATDERLRARAREIAARVFVDLARRGPTVRRGVGKIVQQPFRVDGGDLDIDASFDAIIDATASSRAIDVERLRIRAWTTPQTALCLVVDRSGSMGGKPLATAAIAAAAIALRNPVSYSVIAFGKDVIAVKSQTADRSPERVTTDLLSLRGHGTTDVAGALRAAAEQLGRSNAARKIAVLLSDCRATVEGDAHAAAAALEELAIVAPEEGCEEAIKFANECCAKFATVAGPSGVVEALAAVLDG